MESIQQLTRYNPNLAQTAALLRPLPKNTDEGTKIRTMDIVKHYLSNDTRCKPMSKTPKKFLRKT